MIWAMEYYNFPTKRYKFWVWILQHPQAQQVYHEEILQGPEEQIHSIVYEDIDECLVKKAAIKTKGGCGPSGLDADN